MFVGSVVGGMSFTKYPESQVVKTNTNATFVCNIQSETQLQVTWSVLASTASPMVSIRLNYSNAVFLLPALLIYTF